MTRVLRCLALTIAPLVLLVALTAPAASAQSNTTDPIGDGSLFIVPDMEPSGPLEPVADSSATGGTGGGDASTGLAVTGTDVEPIMAISIGLLALGGSVLVTSRRRLSALD